MTPAGPDAQSGAAARPAGRADNSTGPADVVASGRDAPGTRARNWLGRGIRIGVLVLALVLLLLALRDRGPQALDAARDIGFVGAGASLVAVLVGLAASALVWRSLLTDLGTRLPLVAAGHVFFLGQLAKYVPGNVFAVAAQMELGRRHGAPRSRTATASLLFMGVLVAAGLLTAAAVLPLTSPDALRQYSWVLLALPVGLLLLAPPVLNRLVVLALRLLRRDPLERPLSWGGVGAALGWALLMWGSYGVHLWLLVRPHGSDGTNLLLLSTGAYALAWTAGFLFVIAPAGVGVRELALVAALAPVLDAPAALAVAVLSRVLMTLGDLLWALGGAALGLRRPERHTSTVPSGVSSAASEDGVLGVQPRVAGAEA